MKHSQNSIDAMTADELINGVTNGTIESLQAKDVLRLELTMFWIMTVALKRVSWRAGMMEYKKLFQR